jgi:flagellar biosynthetic protein FlhB
MADEPDQSEKTEDPSQKKLDDALKRGDVAKSQELSSFFVMAGATFAVLIFAGSSARDLTLTLRGILAHAHDIPADQGRLIAFVRDLGLEVGFIVGMPLLFMAAMAVAGNLIQHRMVWSLDPLKPKASKVSPIAGFKRLFSQESLLNFAKGLFKIGLIGTIILAVLWPERDTVDALVFTDVVALMPMTQMLSLKLMGATLAAMMILGIADYAWQRHRWYERQKMTIKEVKDEYKQQEGDPAIKAKLRQVRAERSRKRMMAAVPEATVVITNPTHFAVALKYEQGMPAPLCLAKGVDGLALRIRQLARESDVPIVENPPLARALHATVNIDEEISSDHYKAVAQVIGYVMRLREKAKNRR